MECPKCGKKNKKDALKCIVCGKRLKKKNTKEKTDELIDSITSTIDVKAIKKAEKSILYNLKHIPSKIIISAIIIAIFLLTTIFLSIGFNSISCTYKSKEDNLIYRSNINFNYKNDQVTRFTMRLEYSSSSKTYKKEFQNIYDNIITDLKTKQNYSNIVKSSKSSKHFSIVYNFSPKYIDLVHEYTGIPLEEYGSVKEVTKALEDIGFKCR